MFEVSLQGGEEVIFIGTRFYSKHHCDPKLEDKRTHFSWFDTVGQTKT